MQPHKLSDQFSPVKTDLLQDASEYRLAIQGWHMDCQQISAGRFKSKLTQISLGHVQVIRVRTNRAMMNRGVSWPGSIVFSLLLAASGPSRACGHEIFPSSDLIACEADLPELLTPDEFDLLTLAIDKKWFATKAAEYGFQLIAELTWKGMLRIPEIQYENLQNGLRTLLAMTSWRPQLLAYPEAREQIEDDLLARLLEALRTAPQITVLRDTPRKKTADLACELALSDPSQRLDIARICRVLHVSRRYLQNCFQDSYGQSATQLLRVIRLHRVRQESKANVLLGRHISIGDVAARSGFWHRSTFSREYQTHFGELPSATKCSSTRSDERLRPMAIGSRAVSAA